MKKLTGLAATLAALGVLATQESEALACGGCFAPPETPTVVTDHHMIYSVSSTQATLYDQIQYSGSPSSFAWILPYRGDVTKGDVVVGVSSDVVFRTVDSLTQTQILPPPRNCPPYPANCPALPQAGASATKGGEDSNGGVDVLKQEVVGPYETAHLAAESATDLEKWLTDHGYALTDATKQVIGAYIGAGQQFHFLALKLVPGKDVQSMKPVRITTKGSGFDLPLRMIAAGAGATVGITLWVIAEGRYQAANFDMFTIGAPDLAWDWTNNKSNYIDVRAAKNAATQGKAWELESATSVSRDSITATIKQGGPFSRFGGPYPVPDADAGSNVAGYDADGQKTADEVQNEDFATLFAGIAAGAEHVTRMRADLDHTALDRDLHLQATTDQSEVPTTRNVVNELNEPLCPVYVNCESTTSAPRSQANATITADPAKGGPSSGSDDDGCATSSRRDLSTWLVVGLGALGFVRARKRRRS